jgi:PAS domain S-box-containing protein
LKPGWDPARAILVVEDDEATAELERRALVRSGAVVRVVGRIGDALGLLEREAFSAILLDYQLPDGDAWRIVEVAKSLRPRIPVVLVTAMGNERVAAEAIHRGVVEYVKKTGTFYDELPDVVNRVVMFARTEERLRQTDALFQLIALHAQDMISTDDANGVVTSISPACRRLLGYEPEELIGTRAIDLVHPEDRATTVTARMSSSLDSQISGVTRSRRKDGTYVWVESNSYVVRDPQTSIPVEVITISRDITERKNAEDTARALEASLRASEAHAKAMLDAIPDLMFRMTADGTFMDYRAHATNDLYVPSEKIIGNNVRELMPPAFAEACLGYIRAALETGSRQCWEFQLPLPNGPQDFEARMVPIGSADVLAIVRNISASKAEGVIRNSLREKEVLLKEIHHRVKNNLQVISSLLKLQAMNVPDVAVRDVFAQSRSRVHSIALVHEKLYQSKDLSHVDFDDYVHVLVESLFHAHEAVERGISPVIHVDELNLAVDAAVPCGLIINELVTNALTHGFPDGRTGSVQVALRRVGPDRIELQVTDDGVGLPADVDPRRAASLGLDLVFTFAEQLDAEVEVRQGRGTAFCFRFPCGGA